MKVNPRQRTLRALFKTHLAAFHVQKDQGQALFTLAPPDAAVADEPETTTLQSITDADIMPMFDSSQLD